MGATSTTGTGPGSADGKNRGSSHQTLGFGHIIENPEMAKVFTNFPPDGNWNALQVLNAGPDNPQSASLGQFWIGFHASAFYTWQNNGFINSEEITSEVVVAILNDTEDSIASVTFSDVPPQDGVCPFTSRQITITGTGLNGGAVVSTVVWEWNGQPFSMQVTIFGQE
jgi:hypothetical protein